MAEGRVQRRLAAILAADVVGFSRLMGENEAGTLAALKALRAELFDPTIAEYGGRIVKLMGDGALVEFTSVVDAVECAVCIQLGIAAQGDANKIAFRIGINLGDVIIDGDDIYGDGVNVAARLEALAEPGGICVSEVVHQSVEGKLDLGFADMGKQEVKNIAKPVRAYRTVLSGASESSASEFALPDKQSIAVLPFDNMSGDPEQEYFSDGIAEDIITDLSKISSVFVIARNTAFTYKGRAIDIKQVADELGVRFVLEGSVRKAGNRVRVTAQLIDGESGGHAWADRYDRDLDNIFAIQDNITQNIVDALKVHLDLDEQAKLGGPRTANIEAYDVALRGRSLLYGFTPDGLAESARLFEKSIELDPAYAYAYAGLAMSQFISFTNGWNGAGEEMLERGARNAEKAVEIDPNGPDSYWALALGRFWQNDTESALAAIEKAVALGPSHAEIHATRGYILSFSERPVEAIASVEKSMQLNPQHPALWLHFLGHAHFVNGDYEQAAAALKRRIRRDPETDISRALLVSCYGHLGLVGEATEEWAGLLEISPEFSIERRAQVQPYKNPADWDRVVDGLRKAGLPE